MRKSLIVGILFLAAIFYIATRTHKQLSPFTQYANLIPNSYRLGFSTLNQELSQQTLKIHGTIPSWLEGTLFRNGPAKFNTSSSYVADWFDGLAMIHAFSITHGTVVYSNKYLISDDFLTVQKTGKMSYGGFAQDPCTSWFKKLSSIFIPGNTKEYQLPNANVNIAHYSGKFIALTETPLPIEFDPVTLATLGGYAYSDNYPKRNIHDTPHPHYDPQRKEHLGYFTQFGRKSSHNLFRIKDGSQAREVIASVEIKEPSYMHSFTITPQYAILTALPLVVNPLDLLLKNKAFIKNFKWKPELGTKLIVIDRINNIVKKIYTTEAFFAFHTVNAFEEEDRLILDIITHPTAQGIGNAELTKLLGPTHKNAHADDTGTLKRYTMHASGAVTIQQLSQESIELPRINYAYNGINYNFLYAYTKGELCIPYVATQLLKINVATGNAIRWQAPNCFVGEPVFIASPNATKEDDGVILSVILDAEQNCSFLLILDAQSFQEIARAYVPHSIPFGIHGIFSKL